MQRRPNVAGLAPRAAVRCFRRRGSSQASGGSDRPRVRRRGRWRFKEKNGRRAIVTFVFVVATATRLAAQDSGAATKVGFRTRAERRLAA